MQDDINNTKAELLIKVKHLREQLKKEHKIAAEEIERTIANFQTLSGVISICSYCKVVQNKYATYVSVEDYVTT